jgi:regulator of replication initiation timing
MAKSKKNKTEQMINDLYNEVTRLKMENEKLRNMHGHNSAADTSTIDDAEFEEVDTAQSKPKKPQSENLSKQDQKIIKFASRFAKKLGLDDEDLDEIKEDLANKGVN